MLRNYYDVYKIGHKSYLNKNYFMFAISKIISKLFFPSCDIPFSAEIGENTRFPHRGIGVVVHKDAKIGSECKVQANVVIGGKYDGGVPVIGNNVEIGANACLIGGVTIGDNVIIGAGSVVVKDIPSNTIAVGNPAKVVKTRNVKIN